jgi:transketolase
VFALTFACFLTRASYFIPVAAISNLNPRLAGTHVGVSLGEHGPTKFGISSDHIVDAVRRAIG